MVDGKAVALGIPGRGAAAGPSNLTDTPLNRPGNADEGAKAILFLISPLASYVSRPRHLEGGLRGVADALLFLGDSDFGTHVRSWLDGMRGGANAD